MADSHRTTETSAILRNDLDIFGVAFLMMTPDGQMKRIPPDTIYIDISRMKKDQTGEIPCAS